MRKLKFRMWKWTHRDMFIRVNNTAQYNKVIKLTGHKFRKGVADFHKDCLKDRHPVFIHVRLCTSRIKNTIGDANVITFAEVKDLFNL